MIAWIAFYELTHIDNRLYASMQGRAERRTMSHTAAACATKIDDMVNMPGYEVSGIRTEHRNRWFPGDFELVRVP
jgi:hypothetical protein